MRLLVFALIFGVASCGSYSAADLEVAPAQTGCASDDPRVGLEAQLQGYAHGVAGRAVIVDDCTLELRDFAFDGGGLDVRAIGAIDGDFATGTVLTEDLRRSGGYVDETLRVPFPEGVMLDDVLQLSIWCVPAAANLADVDLDG